MALEWIKDVWMTWGFEKDLFRLFILAFANFKAIMALQITTLKHAIFIVQRHLQSPNLFITFTTGSCLTNYFLCRKEVLKK